MSCLSMSNLVADDLDRTDSLFHQELLGNVDHLTNQLQDMVDLLENYNKHPTEQQQQEKKDLWDQTTGRFNTVLGGLHTFLTGLHLEFSRLEYEAVELEHQREVLEAERDDLIEKSHDLHCRIQYNALEAKLDQTFCEVEKCTSVESAQCFKDEAYENLRRTKEIIRMANLRNCQLDKEIFDEMEDVTNLFQSYQSERENYVKELDLFDDIRRRKITTWLSEARSEEEREKGENIVEFIDLFARQRHLHPKLIGNALRMYSFNESLAFDRQDNFRRLEEMTSLQVKVDTMSGADHVLPRSTAATTDLVCQNEGCISGRQSPNDDDAYSDFVEDQGQHKDSGHGLHRCPRKVNLAIDPITDPNLLLHLETALRWETNDGIVSSAAADPTGDSNTISDIQDPMSTRHLSLQEDAESNTSLALCGDAFNHDKPHDTTEALSTPVVPDVAPHSAHFLLHQIESATALQRSPPRQPFMSGLVKRKSCGGPSSMTAIDDRESKTSTQKLATDERETRSQSHGLESVGRAGSSGGTNSGYTRNSRDHIFPGTGSKSRGD